jgi:hypothetical protein
MTDDTQKLLENPALRLLEAIAAARFERAGVKLGEDWGLPTPRSNPEEKFSPEADPQARRRLSFVDRFRCAGPRSG